jgi:hypothetical protein
MLARSYWFFCLALCEFSCEAKIDFSGDAGVGSGGLLIFGGESALGGSQATGGAESLGGTWYTGGTSGLCNDITCEVSVVLASNQDMPSSIAVDSTHVY